MYLDERLLCCVQGSCNLSLSRDNNKEMVSWDSCVRWALRFVRERCGTWM